jgi:hypothetical protein
MKKLETIEELAKAVGGLQEHFKKAAAHHAALEKVHADLAEAHKAHGEFCKARHEAAGDDDVNKTYFGKAAAFHTAKSVAHTAKSALHKAHAEHCASMADSMSGGDKAAKDTTQKTAASDPPAPAPAPTTQDQALADGKSGVEAMMKETTTGLVKSALQMLKEDPYIQEQIKMIVLDGVRSAVGNEIQPIPGIHKTIGPPQGLTAVTRKGQPEIPDAEKVDPALADMVSA